ncbi:MAG: hypothetical protein JNG82_06760 [Opitutaceae bacterium]|jgi:hypothetical protein|nr:hypothetical protein [Opitutaceae bacterium]
MKPAGFPLLILAVAGTLAAQEPARTSARLAQEIKAALPRYEPPPPPVLDQPKALPADPDILVLPKVTVKEYRPPTHDPDAWLTNKAVGQKAMAAYKQSMTDLEWALNSWFIPLVTPPASARARSAYRTNKFGNEVIRLGSLMDRISAEDPKAAAELRQELKNLVEGRHAGSK